MLRLDSSIATCAAIAHARELGPLESYRDKVAAVLAIKDHLVLFNFHPVVAEDAARFAVFR